MDVILKKKLDDYLKPIKEANRITRITTTMYNNEKYYQNVENTLEKLKLIKENNDFIEEPNLKREYLMNESNPVIVENVLNGEIFTTLKNYYNENIKNNIFPLNDGQSKRYYCHNEFISRIIHFEMLNLLEKITGKKLRPTYTYLSFYIKGAELKAHLDRFECGYTCSFIIDKPAGSNWNIYLQKKTTKLEEYNSTYKPPKNECHALDCNENGLMVINGITNLHYREILEYDYYNVVLLHYNVIDNINECFSYN
jgi:hypothetical protein